MIAVILDALIDSVKLLPFLLLTYLLMEYLEHKTSDKVNGIVKKSGKLGSFIGALLGAIPQCGFSAAASNLYAGRVITLGTLIAIFLSTSDEMLPVMLSHNFNITLIFQIILTKVIIGMLVGAMIDLLIRHRGHDHSDGDGINHLCEHEHCQCEKGIFRSAIKHSLHIFIFIFVISLFINGVIAYVGEEALAAFCAKSSILGIFVAALVGMIPNCAASVVITELFLENIISTGAMMAGLLVGSGVGLLVLFRMNRNIKENLLITVILYFVGVSVGILFQLMGVSFA